MAYKVFISHSTKDQGLVVSLANILTKIGIEVFVAEWYLTPGERLDKKVFKQIENADCIIVLFSKNGGRSSWVHQEVGYAIKSGKIIIPLVEGKMKSGALAALQGKEYIEFKSKQPEEALAKATNYITSLKLKKEEREKALLIVGGIIAFLMLLSGGEK